LRRGGKRQQEKARATQEISKGEQTGTKCYNPLVPP
jgi:hypothetical protein